MTSRATVVRREQGAVLGIVIITSVVCAVAAYSNLMMVTSSARQGQFYREHATGRYVAEAGLIIGMQRLWSDPAYCGGIESVDTDGDGTGDASVTVTVTTCGAGNQHTVSSKATF